MLKWIVYYYDGDERRIGEAEVICDQVGQALQIFREERDADPDRYSIHAIILKDFRDVQRWGIVARMNGEG